MKSLLPSICHIVCLYFLILFGCKKSSPVIEDCNKESINQISTTIKPSKINLYLENSTSMNGYMSGSTEFEIILNRLLRDLEVWHKNISCFYINQRIYPSNLDISQFLNRLNPRDIKIGDVNNSNLNEVFTQVLDVTKNKELSILVSDGIYSLESKKADELKTHIKNSSLNTRGLFLDRLKFQKKLETVVLKFYSKFDGLYYPATGGSVQINQIRPFYVWFFGDKNVIRSFLKEISFKEYEGGEPKKAHFFISENLEVEYTILNVSSEKIGSFRPIDGQRGNKPITKIKNVEKAKRGNNKGRFGFNLAIDYSGLPLDEFYISNPYNYSISSNYQITNIKSKNQISKVAKNDLGKKCLDNCTHTIELMTSSLPFTENLKIEFKQASPNWISDSNLELDNSNNIINNTKQTFAFKYLMNGIVEAYQKSNNSDNYFTIQLEIKR